MGSLPVSASHLTEATVRPEATATDIVQQSRKAAIDTFMALDLQGLTSMYDARME
jgi:hypothetical protein